MNKPICTDCKYHIRVQGAMCCKIDPEIKPDGELFFIKGSYKNKDFKCKDFKPSFFKRRKYNEYRN